MEINVPISQLVNGTEIQCYYILKEGQVKKAANGRPYLAAVLADATGSIEAKSWDYGGSIQPSDLGRIVLIRGTASEYRGTMQITINRIRFAIDGDRSRYDISALVPTAPIDTDTALSDIRVLIASMEDEDYRRISERMLEKHLESFSVIPAAKSVHHGFRCGLLMHTESMMRMADFMAGSYAGLIDRSLLLAGTLMHDMAKEAEFTVSQLGLVTEYSLRGELLGHLVMGAMDVAETAKELGLPEEKSVLLQHMILSHHGQPEMGAAVKPKCVESELLSYIDLIDSRMEIYAEAFETTDAGKFTQRVFSLDKRVYKHN